MKKLPETGTTTEDDRSTVTITLPAAVGLDWDVNTVEAHLQRLGDFRSAMTPAVPPKFALGQRVQVVRDPNWATERDQSGGSLLHIRDPRFGWLHYVIAPDKARKLAGFLQKQVDGPPVQMPGPRTDPTGETRWLSINARHRRHVAFHTSLADFTVSEAESVDPEVLLQRPELNLYCLDHERRAAVFVELPPTVDLTKVPFIHMAQYAGAVRLLEVPFAEFLRSAGELPNIERLVMVYTTGRAGSTLLSHALNRVDGVSSLSEPDAPVTFVHTRTAKGEQPAESRALLDASLRFLFRTTGNRLPAVCALKLRSEALHIADLFQAVYPQAKNLFLYRNALDFVASLHRLFKRMLFPEVFPVDQWLALFSEVSGLDARRLLPLLGRRTGQISIVENLTLLWVSVMERYVAEFKRGLPVTAVRYEDLAAHRETVLSKILEVCDLPGAYLQDALTAFDMDAQEGTELVRARDDEEHFKLSAEQVGVVEAILARHPVINTPGFIAPGTIRVE